MKIADIKVLSVNALLKQEFPATDSILGRGLIDRGGAVVISGPQKIGKSLFGTQLALSLASQVPFLGFDAGKASYRSLVLQAEVNEKRMQHRFQKQLAGFPKEAGEQVLSASVFSKIKLDSHEGVAAVSDWIGAYKPDLLVIDPLSNFHGGDENAAQDMLRITNVLDGFRADGVTVVVVHHHGKGSAAQGNVGHKTRGSSALPGWYDSHLSLEWANAPNVSLRFELRHDETPEDKIISLNSETLQFDLRDDDSAQLSLVIAAVRDLKCAQAEQVAERHHRSRQWASDWLNRAVDQGKLRRAGNRPVLYSLPEDVPPVTRVEIPTPQGVPVVVSTNTFGGLDVEEPKMEWFGKQ